MFMFGKALSYQPFQVTHMTKSQIFRVKKGFSSTSNLAKNNLALDKEAPQVDIRKLFKLIYLIPNDFT